MAHFCIFLLKAACPFRLPCWNSLDNEKKHSCLIFGMFNCSTLALMDLNSFTHEMLSHVLKIAKGTNEAFYL